MVSYSVSSASTTTAIGVKAVYGNGPWGDKGKIYSVFRSLIRIAALSCPTTSPIKNPRKRERVLASFGSPQRSRKFDFALGSLELKEMDDEIEMVRI